MSSRPSRPSPTERIGQGAKRLEDDRLVRGIGSYTADLAGVDTLHCAFVRSPIAHGTLREIDTQTAADHPGVVAVYTGGDLDIADIPATLGFGKAAEYMSRQVLVTDRVRHVGECLALVVATSARAALDATELVWPDLDELPAVTDPARALDADAPRLFDGGDNTVYRTLLAEGPEPGVEPEVSVTVEVESNRLAPIAVETNGIVAEPVGDGLRMWVGHQAPHRFRNEVAMILGLDVTEVRVTVPDVGGAFGMKGRLYPEYLAVAAASLRLGRRLSWIQTRREHFASGTHGRGMRHTVTLDGDREGRIRRARIRIVGDMGAYPHNGSAVPMFARLVAGGMYDIPRMEIETVAVATNLAPTGAYRGAGRPEAALAIERAIDAFARAAQLDPVDVRMTNLIGSLPHMTPTGALYDSGDYAAAIRRAVELLHIDEVRKEQAARREAGEDPVGVGLGSFVERAGGAIDAGEYARVEIDGGEVVVRTGSVDTGQGHATVWGQVARQVFGDLPVRVVSKDTDEVADGVGSFASRSAQAGGSAVQRMAQAVLDQARKRAGERLEVAVEDLVYADGIFSVAGVPGAEVSLFALADGGLADEEMYIPHAQTFPYGAHGAVVEVSLATGEVRIRRLVAVDDCGTVLNPMIVEGQIDGSLAQGVGQALFEEVRYDDTGQPLTASLMDYMLPRAGDVPAAITDRIESPAPSNPLGAKGTGEAGCIGAPAAILNAVLDALAPYGVTDLQLPLRPEKVWTAIHRAAGAA